MTLLETCVKNCNIHFHRYLSSRDFMPSLVQLLKRRRKKLNLVEKLAGIYKNQGWRKIEDRVLGLIQLWADTFMMQEDAYPAYMRIYRELRKEALKFPPRDPNERFMIKFEGEPSPAFELADMEQGVGSSSGVNEERKKVSQEVEETPKLHEIDISNLKEGFKSLEEILCRARDVKELQEPYSKEVIRKCRAGQKKLMWVVSYKTDMADESSIVELLNVMEYVNTKMENFKKAAGILKRGGSSQEIRALLTGKSEKKSSQPLDLLDMGEDFLEIEESNPLDVLEKFIWGREKSSAPKQEEVKKVEIKKVEERKVEEKKTEEKKVEVHRRLEQPDLLFDEPEPVVVKPSQGSLLDLEGLNLGMTPTVAGFPGGVQGYPGYPQPGYPTGDVPAGYMYPNPMYGQPVYQQYPQSNPHFAQPRHPVQPSNDEFEEFFSEIANRRVL